MQNSILYFLISASILIYAVPVQSQRTITLSEAEELFKQRNAELIVTTQTEIINANAAIKEAKLLNNPEISIEQVNLWSTSKQRDGEKELIPPIIGNFAKNTQFSLELSQEIRLGGERRKNIRKEKKNKEVASFENLEKTHTMLLEFKEEVFQLHYAKEYASVLEQQKKIYDTIITNYKKQYELGYIAPTELLRIQAEALQLKQELNDTYKDINSGIETIQSLLGYNMDEIVQIDIPANSMRLENGVDYLYSLLNYNPTILKGKAQIEAQQQNLSYERAVRIPNMTLSANYDRFGGVWKDFIGFGVSFSLPVFNRNQANTKAAKQLTKLASFEVEQENIKLRNKIHTSFLNYQQTLLFLNQLEEEPIIADLDFLLNKYESNILKQNISLIEFIDFMNTYKDTKNILLETQKELFNQYSILEATVGVKLN